jgi:N6-adenosine-specific RNA methylase IME4/DNA-binding XRE family transcriptional regulator
MTIELKPWSEVQEVLPPLSSREKEQLRRGISNGIVKIPILHLPDGRIIDGHHRWELSNHSYPYLEEVDLPEEKAFALALSLNIARRHLSLEQIKTVQERIKRDKETQKELAHQLRQQGMTQADAATVVGVAQQTIDVWEEENITNTKSSNSYIPPDYRITIPKDHKEVIYDRCQEGETQAEVAADYKVSQPAISKIVNQVKKDHKRQEIQDGLEEAALPGKKKYRVIYADPPWKYSNNMPEYFDEQADHYPLMTVKEICELGVKNIAEENAVLFLWITSPILAEAFDVIKAWGFEYKASFVWDKIKHNMGHYNSVRHEFLLVCTCGSCQPDVKKLFDSVVSIERGQHSEKPDYFREIIDTLYPCPEDRVDRIELFSRKQVKGWDYHGNEQLK